MMLESKWNNACFEFPFKKTAKLTGMSMNTINSAISELVNKNFIARHTTGSFGKFPSLYKICVDKKLWKVKISPVVSIL
jgi:Fic family protein